MIDQLLNALVHSQNEAADDVLVEALHLGDAREKEWVLGAILERKNVRSMCGAIREYDSLPEALQCEILEQIKNFHPALREAGRSADVDLRLAALRLIALGRQGKLAYVLSENLHDSNAVLSKAATEAMVALARWISTQTRKLQKGRWDNPEPTNTFEAVAAESEDRPTDQSQSETGSEPADAQPAAAAPDSPSAATTQPAPTPAAPTAAAPLITIPASPYAPLISPEAVKAYMELMAQRPDIEAAVARALDVHRGRHGQDLLRAALLLCDWPGSKTLAVLHTAKHGGQSPMVRRLQQPPASEHVEAFLLGACHGQLRSHFGVAFSHINEAPVLDALLRKTHWLRDHNMQTCMHQVTRGVWSNTSELVRDIDRRTPEDAARVGEWIAVSGSHDMVQDERLEKILVHCAGNFNARLRLLRIAAARRKGTSVQLLKSMLADSDERLVRMAAREIIRRRPPEFENMLLQLMTNAPESVRRVVSRRYC